MDKRSCKSKGVSWAKGRKRGKDTGKIKVQKGNGVGVIQIRTGDRE